jgi:hypothetical protein
MSLTRALLFAFSVANLVFNTLISWKTTQLVLSSCSCVTRNIYWVYIYIYLLYGMTLGVYTLLYSFKIIEADYMVQLMTIYALCTVVFVVASFRFTKYLKENPCVCVDDEFKRLLSIMTYLRQLAVGIGIVVLTGWLIWTWANKKIT